MKERKKPIIFFIILHLLLILFLNTRSGAQVVKINPEELKKVLGGEITLEYDFLLVDIRDDVLDITSGIIASDNCKPYHLPYNEEGLKGEKKEKLPKDIPIILYCKSGVKVFEAANYLWNEGFSMVGAMEGGITLYKTLGGEIRDSSEFKPLDKLPEPSYFGKKSNISYERKKKERRYTIHRKDKDNDNTSTNYYNLQGRILPYPANNNAPVYILERIGEGKSKGKIKGLHRLVVEK
ncbi:MAG: rhodanese-like domain-containing protein [Chitinispirillaceae bacterium]|nr:rhodanese-like domain-containing protein [Chitinispirillaceae bacterium]